MNYQNMNQGSNQNMNQHSNQGMNQGMNQNMNQGMPPQNQTPRRGGGNNFIKMLVIIAIVAFILGFLPGLMGGGGGGGTYTPPSSHGGYNNPFGDIGFGLGDLADTVHSDVHSSSDARSGTDYTYYQDNWETPGGSGTWTILLYFCGSDLETNYGMATGNLQEIANASYSDNINVVLETGGSRSWQISGIDASKLQRFEISDGHMTRVDSVSGASMGDESTFEDFLKWGTANYPADHYMLVLWDHGGGSVSGVCFDERYGMDSLDLGELSTALKNSKAKFDVIGFDACLMATLETAQAIAPYSKYMIGSEESEPGSGWAYTTFLEYLDANPSATGAQVGRVICDTYYEKCDVQGAEYMATLSVIDLSKIGKVSTAFDSMAASMVRATTNSGDFRTLTAAASSTEYYSDPQFNMIDLGDLAIQGDSVLSPSSDNMVAAIESAVVYQVKGSTRGNAHGISVFYPLSTTRYELDAFVNICQSRNYLIYVDTIVDGWDGGFTGQEVTITDPDVTEPTVEEPIQSDDYNVTFTEEVRDDGTFQLSITSGLEIVSTVRFELYYLDESSGKYIRLGSDNNLYADWTTGVFTDNFWGKWLSIDGHYVEADIIGQGVDYSLYSIPVLLNDEEYNLWARYDYEKKRYVILGCFQGIDPDTGLSSRDVLELHRGDHIQFLFRTYDPATGAEGYATMGDISYTSRTKMEEMDLVDGRYLYRYVITDTFGNVYYSNPAQMRCDSGDIYVSEVQF